MKPSFVEYNKPLLCCMIPDRTPEAAIDTIMNAHFDGADAFGFQLEGFFPEYLNEESFRKVFKACMGKPIYVTSYRGRSNLEKTDDECMEVLWAAIRAGATMVDVMGDLYDKQTCQMTFDEEAVAKQKELIKRFHDAGVEVLMSSHTHAHLDEDTIVMYAKAQRERGADVCKIVNYGNTPEESDENLRAVIRLNRELDGKFLFLVNGDYFYPIRHIGTSLGVCMWLCVQNYNEETSREQPLLRAMKAVRDNLFFR